MVVMGKDPLLCNILGAFRLLFVFLDLVWRRDQGAIRRWYVVGLEQ